MDKIAKIQRDKAKLSPLEREALSKIVAALKAVPDTRTQEAIAEAVAGFIAAAARTHSKQASDRRTDAKRRILTGARLKREDAERYREAACASGRSLYAFVTDALEAEYLKTSEFSTMQAGQVET